MKIAIGTAFIAAALATTIVNSTDAVALSCDVYASEAVRHHQLNLSLNCGYSGDRWHSNSGSHLIWCTFAGDRQRQSHQNYRTQKISECKLVVVPGQPQVVPAPKANNSGNNGNSSSGQQNGPVAKGVNGLWCNNWAYEQEDLARHYENNGCKLAGDQSQSAHYNFCMTSSRDKISAKPVALMQEGNSCLANSQSAVSPNPPSVANSPSASNIAEALRNHCAAFTQEAWAVTSNAISVCSNAFSVPTSKAGIQSECLKNASEDPDLGRLRGFISGRMDVLRNLVNICDHK